MNNDPTLTVIRTLHLRDHAGRDFAGTVITWGSGERGCFQLSCVQPVNGTTMLIRDYGPETAIRAEQRFDDWVAVHAATGRAAA